MKDKLIDIFNNSKNITSKAIKMNNIVIDIVFYEALVNSKDMFRFILIAIALYYINYLLNIIKKNNILAYIISIIIFLILINIKYIGNIILIVFNSISIIINIYLLIKKKRLHLF